MQNKRDAKRKPNGWWRMKRQPKTTTRRLSFIIDIKMVHILFIIPSWLHAAPTCTASKWNEKKLIKSSLSSHHYHSDSCWQSIQEKLIQAHEICVRNSDRSTPLVNDDDDNVIRHYNFDFAFLVYRRWANIRKYIKIC